MTTRQGSTFRHSVAVRGIVWTAGVFAGAALLGFVVFPLLLPNSQRISWWEAICSAAGVVLKPSSATPVAPTYSLSTTVVTSAMLTDADPQSVGRGATVAHQCAICHEHGAENGVVAPSLSGQYASAIYKELHDFKSGARSNEIMEPMAAALSDGDIVDVSRYYASLARPANAVVGANVSPPVIAITGAPLRNIPPCGSCHGAIDHKVAAPRLEGQPAGYIQSQLQAFAHGDRHNDTSQQMRNIARQMTAEEIDAVANYYSALR